jgi:hypothetical protein
MLVLVLWRVLLLLVVVVCELLLQAAAEVGMQERQTSHLLVLLLVLLPEHVQDPAVDEVVDSRLCCSTYQWGGQAPVKATDLQRHTATRPNPLKRP